MIRTLVLTLHYHATLLVAQANQWWKFAKYVRYSDNKCYCTIKKNVLLCEPTKMARAEITRSLIVSADEFICWHNVSLLLLLLFATIIIPAMEACRTEKPKWSALHMMAGVAGTKMVKRQWLITHMLSLLLVLLESNYFCRVSHVTNT